MADLTPSQALDMIHRSMLTGVPTSEFNAAGGYDKVYSLAASSGGDMGRPSDEAIKRYGPQIAAQGYGNMSYAPGNTVNDPALAASGYDNYYDQALKKKSSSFFEKQIATLQKSYDDLLAKSSRNTTTGGTTGSLTGGGAAVNAGGTNIDTGNTGAGTSGPVYGPDGRMYSSAASAIAAGVTNYTRTKPTGILAGVDTLGAGGGGTAARGFMSNDANTGNVNPGGLIANQSQQLFNVNPNVSLPPGVVNPFRV
jgi:hypothetical protein